jgi:hypothetical protein
MVESSASFIDENITGKISAGKLKKLEEHEEQISRE